MAAWSEVQRGDGAGPAGRLIQDHTATAQGAPGTSHRNLLNYQVIRTQMYSKIALHCQVKIRDGVASLVWPILYNDIEKQWGSQCKMHNVKISGFYGKPPGSKNNMRKLANLQSNQGITYFIFQLILIERTVFAIEA